MLMRLNNFSLKEYAPVLVSCILFMSSTTSALAADEPDWQGKPFSATQLIYEKVLPAKKIKSKVFISPDGVRMVSEDSPDSPIKNVISIYRFKDEKSWLIDPLQKTYVLLEGGEVADDDGDLGGIFSDKPCMGYSDSKEIGKEKFQGRDTIKWACRNDKKNIVVIQNFDPKLNTVIRVDVDGEITELLNIKPGKQNKKLFLPPEKYRKASMVEMMTGHMKLPNYSE